MELRHLRYFAAVAEELHFGRAAKKLRMSQPPLSQQIRKLEEELGVRLLNRTRREVSLTPAGRAFLERARVVLQEVEKSTDAVSSAARGETGKLDIGYVPYTDILILPRLIRRFQRDYPGVGVRLHPLSGVEQAFALRESRIDLAFLRLPVENGDLHIRPLCRESLVLAVPQAHPLARRPAVTLADLDQVPYIGFPRRFAPGYYDHLADLVRRAGSVPRVVVESSNVYEKLTLVACGAGVTLLGEAVRGVRREGVVYKRIRPSAPLVESGIAYRKGAQSEVQKTFLAILRRLYRGGEAGSRPSKTS